MAAAHQTTTGHFGPGTLRSELLIYPDRQLRIVTMKGWFWDAVPVLERSGYPLEELLSAALQLAEDLPSGRGFDLDVLDATAVMIKAAYCSMQDH